MKNAALFAVLCFCGIALILFIAYKDGAFKGKKHSASSSNEIRWGCMAVRSDGKVIKRKKGGHYSGVAANKAEALSITRLMFLEDFPGKEPGTHCWDCSRQDLDALAREICE